MVRPNCFTDEGETKICAWAHDVTSRHARILGGRAGVPPRREVKNGANARWPKKTPSAHRRPFRPKRPRAKLHLHPGLWIGLPFVDTITKTQLTVEGNSKRNKQTNNNNQDGNHVSSAFLGRFGSPTGGALMFWLVPCASSTLSTRASSEG